MKIAIKLLMLGALLSSVLGCRSSTPPATDICIGDGLGGADCTLSTGEHAYKTPSELKDSWIIPDQKQATAFVSWCYDTSPRNVKPAMEKTKEAAQNP